MEKVYARTKTIQDDKVSGFCPGCMHSTVIKLIGEVLEEMHLVDKASCVLGIGCCGLHMDYIAYDNITAPHGRACAVATGIKRSNPDSLVFTSIISVCLTTFLRFAKTYFLAPGSSTGKRSTRRAAFPFRVLYIS